MILKIKIKEIDKELIKQECIKRYDNSKRIQESYVDKVLLVSLFDKAYKSVSNYCLDNTSGEIKDKKELISRYSGDSKHDSYNCIEDIIEWFAGHTVFCEMTRLYYCQMNK